jgi:hypothetical protein
VLSSGCHSTRFSRMGCKAPSISQPYPYGGLDKELRVGIPSPPADAPCQVFHGSGAGCRPQAACVVVRGRRRAISRTPAQKHSERRYYRNRDGGREMERIRVSRLGELQRRQQPRWRARVHLVEVLELHDSPTLSHLCRSSPAPKGAYGYRAAWRGTGSLTACRLLTCEPEGRRGGVRCGAVRCCGTYASPAWASWNLSLGARS